MSERRLAILRAAEKIFAREGYHGTSMRDIAAEAGVKLPLIVYHFDTKLALYTAVFANRQYVNEERLAMLAAIGDLTADDALERIVRAFVDPILALHADPDGIWFGRLLMREAADPSSRQRPIIGPMFDPVARRFIEAFRVALPDKPSGFHQWAYLFSVGAVTQSSYDDRAERLTGDAVDTDLERRAALLRSYLVAGLRYG